MLGWYSRFSGRAGQPFAPMYTYSQINGGSDGGSYPDQRARTSRRRRAATPAPTTRRATTTGRTSRRPAERANAAHFKIKGYETLFMGPKQAGSSAQLRQALATNHPVAIEMAVRAGFEQLGSSPAAVDTDTTSDVLGYHEVLARRLRRRGSDRRELVGHGLGGRRVRSHLVGRRAERRVGSRHDRRFRARCPRPRRPRPWWRRVAGGATQAARRRCRTRSSGRARPGRAARSRATTRGTRPTAARSSRCRSRSATATSFTLTTKVGHTYRVAVQAHAGDDRGRRAVQRVVRVVASASATACGLWFVRRACAGRARSREIPATRPSRARRR